MRKVITFPTHVNAKSFFWRAKSKKKLLVKQEKGQIDASRHNNLSP
jgi:hypothetical protein